MSAPKPEINRMPKSSFDWNEQQKFLDKLDMVAHSLWGYAEIAESTSIEPRALNALSDIVFGMKKQFKEFVRENEKEMA